MALIDSCSHTHLMEKVLVVVVIFVIYDAIHHYDFLGSGC